MTAVSSPLEAMFFYESQWFEQT